MAMTARNESSTDARTHTGNIKSELDGLIAHLRQDVDRVTDVKARVLFETTAEVLTGLKKAYDDYDNGSESAFKR